MAKYQIHVEPRYITVRDVCVRYSISPRTVWRWVQRGILPTPVYIGCRESGGRWLVAELDRLDAEREQSRVA